MELTAIAAAVIGGVYLSGGVGSMLGPIFGAFLLGIVLLGLTLLGAPQFTQQIATGLILLATVSYDRLLLLRRRKRQTVEAARGMTFAVPLIRGRGLTNTGGGRTPEPASASTASYP